MGLGAQFIVRNTQHVFNFDALENSHPMSVPVSKRNEVNEIFDDIPYFKGIRLRDTCSFFRSFVLSCLKGPSVIRMLASFLGQPTFRAGLTEYLNQKYEDSFHVSRSSFRIIVYYVFRSQKVQERCARRFVARSGQPIGKRWR